MLMLDGGAQTPVYEEVYTSYSRSFGGTAIEGGAGPKDMRTSVSVDLETQRSGRTTGQSEPDGKEGEMATSATASVIAQQPQRVEARRHSAAFGEFVLSEQVKVMGPALLGLKSTLDQPEGARFMSCFRDSLARLWDVRDALPKETVLLLSAIEESVRGKKWRELAPSQIDVLSGQVAKLRGRGFSAKHLQESLKTMQRNWLDIFPSADNDYEQLEDAEESEEA